mmetsp:Transcript_5026/g.10410  ORF Transcript_5026/g.10410 Transcript_5026/m.10410 type:complete len:117 (+) Transcript_5026:31-381(+)
MYKYYSTLLHSFALSKFDAVILCRDIVLPSSVEISVIPRRCPYPKVFPTQRALNLPCFSLPPIVLAIDLEMASVDVGAPHPSNPSFEAFLVEDMATLCANNCRWRIFGQFFRGGRG